MIFSCLLANISAMIKVMKRYRIVYLVACTVIALTLLGIWLVHGVHFDVLAPSGAIAEQQKSLLLFALLLSAIVVVPVFTMLGLFAWKYREGGKAKHTPEWSENSALEALWWGIPIIIIVVLAVVTWRTSHSLDPYRPIASSHETLEVQVVALQWKWLFIYPDENIATVNKLVVPEDVPVHFTLTADAPMSAFWVPALGTQIYTINGMSSQLYLIADHTGQFEGYTTNINGKGYADMKFVVDARSQNDFSKWTDTAKASSAKMDIPTYEQIAKPGMMGQKEYALADSSLYDTIINKYMPMYMMDDSGTTGMEGM